jgi:uncharacterized repeat protein (TIGR02543 family)
VNETGLGNYMKSEAKLEHTAVKITGSALTVDKMDYQFMGGDTIVGQASNIVTVQPDTLTTLSGDTLTSSAALKVGRTRFKVYNSGGTSPLTWDIIRQLDQRDNGQMLVNGKHLDQTWNSAGKIATATTKVSSNSNSFKFSRDPNLEGTWNFRVAIITDGVKFGTATTVDNANIAKFDKGEQLQFEFPATTPANRTSESVAKVQFTETDIHNTSARSYSYQVEVTRPASYIVTFVPNNTQPNTVVYVEKSALIPAIDIPADPTRAGYTFEGWYSDSAFAPASKWDFATNNVVAGMTLYAKWVVAGSTSEQVQVVFSSDGNIIKTVTVAKKFANS